MSTPSTPSTALAPQFRALVAALQERRARTSADRSLARRLHGAFEASDLGVSGLTLHVRNGTVVVYGQVRTEVQREAVLALAAEQPGARMVTDCLDLPSA